MKFLLDTDTCISVLRGRSMTCRRLNEVSPDDCGVSTVTVFELMSGVERCRNPEEENKKVLTFLAPLHLLPFDHLAAEQAARIRWQLEKSGCPIGPYDLQIAGQALALNVTLVTGNIGEFRRVMDLPLANWMR